MPFTYVPSAPNDITRVRYHIGDTDETCAIFDDDEIQMALNEEGSMQKAVIASIQSVLARLSHEPDLQADWLRVDWRRSADHWRALLADKKQAFGLTARVTTSVVTPYRIDSKQTDPPDYSVDEDDDESPFE